MKCNVGGADRILRAIIGVVIVVLGLVYKSWWGVVGIIPLLTALIGFCPLYVPFKISTAKKQK